MKKLKVCFIGIGSIAKRHIRNLREICGEQDPDLIIDAFRRDQVTADGVDTVYTDPDSMPDDYDVIFITNPTHLHMEALERFHNKGRHFFIEKPLVSYDQIDRAGRFALRDDSVYYVACPLRYNQVIRWIKENVEPSDVISVRSISSSYLPDWRPGQDYRTTYSAHRDMGGGVSIDLIHEWDYLTWLFGWPEQVHSLIGRKSSLEIDSDDYAIYIAEYSDKIVELHLDYFGRQTIREIQLITHDDTIIGNLVNNRVLGLVSGTSIEFAEERDDYQKQELKYFLDLISDKGINESGYQHGLDVLELTRGIYDNRG